MIHQEDWAVLRTARAILVVACWLLGSARSDDALVPVSTAASPRVAYSAVPLATLGFNPQPRKNYKLDHGVIFSDATGTNRQLRMNWANKATGLVNDVPGEIMPSPILWGSATLAAGSGK